MVEDLVGVVAPTAVDEVLLASRIPSSRHYYGYRHHDNVVTLSRSPIASVTSVTMLDGAGNATVVPAEDLTTGVAQGWRRVANVLIVPFNTGPATGYRVQYVAGYDEVPPNYRLAALKIVAQMWRNSELGAIDTGIPPIGAPDREYAPGLAYPLSWEVRQLLGIYSDHVGPQGGVTLA